MSEESSSDGLSDWSLVTGDGDIETADQISNSSDDFLKDFLKVSDVGDPTPNIKEQDACSTGHETEPAACSLQTRPVVSLDSSVSAEIDWGSIDEETSSSTSSSDVASDNTDVTSYGVAGGFVENIDSFHLDCEGMKGAEGPVCFSPDSPESLRLQEHMESQSRCLPTLQTIAVIQLSNTLDLSSDTDSDFIHLDQSLSGDSSDSDELLLGVAEEEHGGLPPVPIDVLMPMERSASSVSSRFRFLARGTGREPVASTESDDDLDERDADTESVGEADNVDDRIESDRSHSDDGAAVLHDDIDWSLVNDIADIPLVAGDVPRQYVHRPNRGLNWTLDVVVVLVISVALGLGIGHSIGSMRVHHSQEKQLNVLQQELAVSQKKEEEFDHARQMLQDTIGLQDKLMFEFKSSQRDILREKQRELDGVKISFNEKKQQLEEENQELKSLLQTAESSNARLQESVSAQQRWVDERRMLLELLDKRNVLEWENSDLKVQIGKFRYGSHPGNEKIQLNVQTSSEKKPVHDGNGDGENVFVDLKNTINQLELQNEDLRGEIILLQSQPRRANIDKNRKDGSVDDVTLKRTDRENSSLPPPTAKTGSESTASSSQDEIIKQLTVVLEHEQAQTKKWRHLYESQNNNNSQVDIHSCLNLISEHLNSSVSKYVNLSTIFSVIGNVSHTVVENVMEVKNHLFSEVKQNYESVKKTIYEEFASGAGNRDERDTKTKTRSDRKRWVDTVNEVLNKTRSSVENVSRQIQDTWVHVKNLSEKFWKKYEPSFVEVANKLSKNVADITRKLQDKIKKKAAKWMRKHTDRNEKLRKKTQFNKKKSSEKKKGKGSKTFPSEHRKMNEKGKKYDQVHKMEKKFLKVLEKTYSVNAKRHMSMDREDIDDMCAMFSQFVSLSGVGDWLSGSNKAWFICQSDWWHDRRDGMKRHQRGCRRHMQDWQWDWEPSFPHDGDQKRRKGCKQCAKCNKRHKKKCCEKHKNKHHGFQNEYHSKYQYDDNFQGNQHHYHGTRHHHHEGNPHDYHSHQFESWDDDFENMYDDDDPVFWQMDDDFPEDPNDTFWFDLYERQEDWYFAWGRNRGRQHLDEHKSDWMFDRAADREEKRSTIPHSSQATFAKPIDLEFRMADIDSKAEWLFSRAEDRDYQRTRPETWYFERARYRTNNNFNFDIFDN